MIARVFKGKSPYGLIKYLYGEGRRNEHDNAHLVASWDGNPTGLEPAFVDGLDRHDVAPLVRTLEQPVRGCDRVPEKWVYHLVLRSAPEDRRLTDEEWAEVATAAMQRTGIAPADDPAGCRWVAVRHADGEEDHIHVVATLAREDGRPPRIWGDYAALGQVVNEFEEKFGLRSTAGRRDKTAAQRPGVKETVTAENKGRRRPPRVELRDRVQSAAASSHDYREFVARLSDDGVTVWPRMSDRNPDEITGYSVSLNGWTNAAGEPIRWGGSKLAPDLSLPKLQVRWDPATGTNTPPDSEQAKPTDAGSGTRTGRRDGPLTADEADAVWREAERIVREAAEQIKADATTNPDAAADAAWAASDTLSAAAAGFEGPAGGPLTDAARAFERAGRDVNRRTPTRSDSGTALRSAGRMIAILAAGSTHPGARVAAVTTALVSLTAAVADLRRTQQRLHQAEAAHVSAQRLRAAVAVPASARNDTEPPPPRTPNAADLAATGWAHKPSKVRRRPIESSPLRPPDGRGHPAPKKERRDGPTIA